MPLGREFKERVVMPSTGFDHTVDSEDKFGRCCNWICYTVDTLGGRTDNVGALQASFRSGIC